jgi:hypothetical protein
MRTNPLQVGLLMLAIAAAQGALAAPLAADAGRVDEDRSAVPAVSLQLAQAQEAPAAPGQNEQEPRRRRGPPPEAIEACKGKAVGAPCSFTNRRNQTRTGNCLAPPANAAPPGNAAPLACRPERAEGTKTPG